MGERTLETLVGAVVLAVATGFLVFAYDRADVSGGGGYELSADFTNVGGLRPGADVRLAGIKVGAVTGLELDTEFYLARVTMSIDPEVTLTDDTFAAVAADGLLGGRHIALTPGGAGDRVPDGGRLYNTQPAVDLIDILSRAVFAGGAASAAP